MLFYYAVLYGVLLYTVVMFWYINYRVKQLLSFKVNWAIRLLLFGTNKNM